MVERIGGGSLAKAAIEAALKRQAELRSRLQQPETDFASQLGGSQGAAGPSSVPATAAGAFSEPSLLQQVNQEVLASDRLTEQVLKGQVTDFAQAAAQLKQSDLAFRFALEVRNKFVDAYREVMRMSV
jgi:flagellar hook-basal body complex protein FliE